jgi:RNA-directed DNA polymerase
MSHSADEESNYRRLRKTENLRKAWFFVKRNGLRSTSPETRRLVREFEAKEWSHVRRIADRLLKRTFEFGLAKGVLIPRPGKAPRPIVLASIEARIVQRAILDDLHREARLKPYFINDHSFGGIQRRGRGDAIRAALEVMRKGARFFVRSDIKDFFTQIPRERALALILPLLDPPTCELLRRAVTVELENAATLGALRDLFPDEERGVAQGFCLSSLFGNILLAEFDRQMNDRGVRCLRYVDDFLLLADSERRAMKAFDGALRMLGELGLTAYDPRVKLEKAALGHVTPPFEFLGCALQPGLVAPSKKSIQRLLEKVDERLRAGRRYIESGAHVFDRQTCFSRVLADVGNIVHGWRELWLL